MKEDQQVGRGGSAKGSKQRTDPRSPRLSDPGRSLSPPVRRTGAKEPTMQSTPVASLPLLPTAGMSIITPFTPGVAAFEVFGRGRV